MPRDLYQAAAAYYVALAPLLRAVARDKGYALGVHGSLTTDLDLIAAPWTEDAKAADELVEALRECVGGEFRRIAPACMGCRESDVECKHVDGPMALRPHGRRAWTIYFANQSGPYIDISVMPRSSDKS